MNILELVRHLQQHILMGNYLEAQAITEQLNDMLLDALEEQRQANRP
jgi:hypothetical protein